MNVFIKKINFKLTENYGNLITKKYERVSAGRNALGFFAVKAH